MKFPIPFYWELSSFTGSQMWLKSMKSLCLILINRRLGINSSILTKYCLHQLFSHPFLRLITKQEVKKAKKIDKLQLNQLVFKLRRMLKRRRISFRTWAIIVLVVIKNSMRLIISGRSNSKILLVVRCPNWQIQPNTSTKRLSARVSICEDKEFDTCSWISKQNLICSMRIAYSCEGIVSVKSGKVYTLKMYS